MRITTRLVDWALTACESDPVVAERFFAGHGLIDHPNHLLHPAFVYRVAVVEPRRRRGDGRPRQAKVAGRGNSRNP